MVKPKLDKKYTDLWVKDFNYENVDSYNKKWFNKFEKNSKHIHQIEIVKNYLKPNTRWLDAPVGSGRIFKDIKHPKNNFFALDNSSSFISYVKNKYDIDEKNIVLKDLYKLDQCFEKIDLVTCFNTLFALSNIDKIINNFKGVLKKEGILIFDVKWNYNNIKQIQKEDYYHFTKKEIRNLVTSCGYEVIDIISHDYFDSRKFNQFKMSQNYLAKLLFKTMYFSINILYFKTPLKYLFHWFQKLNFKKEKLIIICKK